MSISGGRVLVLARRQSLVMRAFVALLTDAGVPAATVDECDDPARYADVVALLVCDALGARQVGRVLGAQQPAGHRLRVVSVDGVAMADADVLLPPHAGTEDLLVALGVAQHPGRATWRATRTAAPGTALRLTARERQVVALLADGTPTAGIAERLGISVNTVRTHVQNIMGKLGVSSRLEVASIAAARPRDPADAMEPAQ